MSPEASAIGSKNNDDNLPIGFIKSESVSR